MSAIKPKPKYLLWPIKTDADNPMNKSELKAIDMSPAPSAGKCTCECMYVSIGFGFPSDWVINWHKSF